MHRVGIDLIEIEDIRASLETHGETYLGRIFTPAERRGCGASHARLAECFAAKEATMKALGRADEGWGWQAIEVIATAGSAPAINLRGEAAAMAAALGLGKLQVSLGHDRAQAMAVVIAEPAR